MVAVKKSELTATLHSALRLEERAAAIRRAKRGQGDRPGKPEFPMNNEDLALYVAHGGKPSFYAEAHDINPPIVFRRFRMMRRVVKRWAEVTLGEREAKEVDDWPSHKVCRVWLTIDADVRTALADSRSPAYKRFMETMS